MEPISVICIIIAIPVLVFGVIVPIINLRKCTFGVFGTAKDIKCRDSQSESFAQSGDVTYHYKGKTYRKRRMNLGLHNGNATVSLLIDPANPKRCILNDRKVYRTEIIIFACMTVLLVVMAVMASSGM